MATIVSEERECPKCGSPVAYYELNCGTNEQELRCGKCRFRWLWEQEHPQGDVFEILSPGFAGVEWKKTEYFPPTVPSRTEEVLNDKVRG